MEAQLDIDHSSTSVGLAVEADEPSRLTFAFEIDGSAAKRPLSPVQLLQPTTVAILGLGYVGLPTALALVQGGVSVLGVDVSTARLQAIRERRVDLIEMDQERLAAFVDSPALTLTSDAAALQSADAVLICVPTPVDEHLAPDLTALRGACATAVANAVAGQTIVLTSTSYVGCTRDFLVEPLIARGLTPGRDIFVAFSPERIDPGNVVHTQESVPRVIGGVTPECTRRAASIVGHVTQHVHQVSSPEAAELTKLYENTFRAVNIALANEMSDVSASLGIDIHEVIEAASTKPYGFTAFTPGTGVGGHCIPCDPHYLLWQLRAARTTAPVIEQAMQSIALRPGQIVNQTVARLSADQIGIRGARVLVLGVAYKPGVADVRESPALEILTTLRGLGAIIEYSDKLVPVVNLGHGEIMRSTVDPVGRSYDAIIVHAVHPGTSLDWLRNRRVIDPSGKLRDLAPRPSVFTEIGSLTGAASGR
jgi:UDP-N-acetyl-D-glucosamine dehydrogenase